MSGVDACFQVPLHRLRLHADWFGVLLLYGIAAAQAQPVTPAARDAVLAHAESFRVAHQIPGLAMAVVRSGEVVLAEGLGVSTLEHRTPMSADTPVQIGSLMKSFTALGLLQLQAQGRLSLDDRLAGHLPGAAKHFGTVTLRQLLDHTAGIPDPEYLFDERERPKANGFAWINARVEQTEASVAKQMLRDNRPRFAPGTQREYSNAGYMLAGVVASRVVKRPFKDWLQTVLFQPAQLATLQAVDPETVVPAAASGYTRQPDGRMTRQVWTHPSLNRLGDGGQWASARDLARWLARLQRAEAGDEWAALDRLAQSSAELRGGEVPAFRYGLGWFVDEADGRHILHHGGGVYSGFKSTVVRWPDDDLAIVVLTNRYPESAVDSLVHELAGLLDPRWALPAAVSTAEVAAHAASQRALAALLRDIVAGRDVRRHLHPSARHDWPMPRQAAWRDELPEETAPALTLFAVDAAADSTTWLHWHHADPNSGAKRFISAQVDAQGRITALRRCAWSRCGRS